MPARTVALLSVLLAVVLAVAAGANATAVAALQTWFVDNFQDGETQLVAGVSADRAALGDEHLVCGGLPALQTRSSTVPSNGACPDVFTAVNGSCTCLTGLSSDSETWNLHVRPKSSTDPSRGTANGDSFPATQAATEVLEIDAIRSLWAPTTLHTLYVAMILLRFTAIDTDDDRCSSWLKAVRGRRQLACDAHVRARRPIGCRQHVANCTGGWGVR